MSRSMGDSLRNIPKSRLLGRFGCTARAATTRGSAWSETPTSSACAHTLRPGHRSKHKLREGEQGTPE